jgi:hypothetical protein
MQDNNRTGLAEGEKLRELARWYRVSPNAPAAPRFGRRDCGWPKISNGRRTAWARRLEPVNERSALRAALGG